MHTEISSTESKLQQLMEHLKDTQEALNEDHFNPQLIEVKTTLKIIEKWDGIQE